MLGRVREAPQQDVSEPATEESATQEQSAVDDSQSAEPERITLTKAELDDLIQRRAQSETDRREAKRQKDMAEAERRRLRDEDPFGYAEQDRKAEQLAQEQNAYGSQIATVAQSLDRALLDPLLERVPEKDRAKLWEVPDAGVGIDGRKALASAAIDTLEKHWKAEGEKAAAKKLRDNPAFRKQILAELRDSPELEEPEQITGTPRGVSSNDVNAILRQQLGIG